MAFAPRTWLHLLCLWLSIATVLGHAIAPVGSPLVRQSGSAFSAATTDVALGSVRAGLAKAKRTVIDENPGASGDLDLTALAESAAAVEPPAPGEPPAFRSTNSPASFPAAHGFHARAPPMSTARI